ncbi:MAG: hypothetical protein ABSH04_03570 [Acidimicrobiales bacterium]
MIAGIRSCTSTMSGPAAVVMIVQVRSRVSGSGSFERVLSHQLS